MNYYSKELKEEVIERIKNEGKTVSQIALEYGLNTKTLYRWLHTDTFKDTNILEINKLRREKQELLEIIGQVTVELNRGKKGRGGK